MQVILVVVGLFTALVTNAAAQACPANLNSEAQIVLYSDRTTPLDATAGVDTNLTFFREVLGFDDAQIQHETQNAFQFFNERFGLDFSLLEPNELGVHFFQNATFQPFRVACGPTANFNRCMASHWKHSVKILYYSFWWIPCCLQWRADTERNIRWRRGSESD